MPRKTVLITGSSQGLGKHLALEFSKIGYEIILHGRNEESLNDAKKQVEKNSECLTVIGDIRSDETINELQEVARLNSLDILVNNVGVYLNQFGEDTPIEDYKRVMEINFFAPIKLMKATLPIFKEKGSGLIVNINSIAGEQGSPKETAYCASKHALRGFSNSLKPEVIEYARIIDVYLGAMATQMTKGIRPDFEFLIQPEEAAKAIVRNCEDYKTLCPKEISLRRIKYK